METLFDTLETKDEKAEYDRVNPGIWYEFKKIAFQLIAEGFQHYSSDGILHIVRFQTRSRARNGHFKINNNMSSYYARKFAAAYPLYKEFFETRKVKDLSHGDTKNTKKKLSASVA